MKNALITILEAFGYPVYLQGSLNEEDNYPESFFTIWNYETPERFYSNKPISAIWGFWVYFYSTDPALVESVTNSAINSLRAAGWILQGRGEDALSDEPTHTGRMLTVNFIEQMEAENE